MASTAERGLALVLSCGAGGQQVTSHTPSGKAVASRYLLMEHWSTTKTILPNTACPGFTVFEPAKVEGRVCVEAFGLSTSMAKECPQMALLGQVSTEQHVPPQSWIQHHVAPCKTSKLNCTNPKLRAASCDTMQKTVLNLKTTHGLLLTAVKQASVVA